MFRLEEGICSTRHNKDEDSVQNPNFTKLSLFPIFSPYTSKAAVHQTCPPLLAPCQPSSGDPELTWHGKQRQRRGTSRQGAARLMTGKARKASGLGLVLDSSRYGTRLGLPYTCRPWALASRALAQLKGLRQEKTSTWREGNSTRSGQGYLLDTCCT